jgi:phospholipid transport system substrate-binding protein
MNSTRRQLVSSIGAALFSASPFVAASVETDPSWAAAYVRRIGDELAAIMANAGSAEARRQRLQLFIDRVADIDATARFCLGRFWHQATPVQRQEYVQLFHGVLMNAVLSRVGDYEHNEVRVIIDRPEPRDSVVHVPTVVERTGNPPVRVTWVVSADADNPRIVDVMAEGVSLRLTTRSDYNAFLGRHGNSVDALINALRQQACNDCAPPNPLGRR